ncbi:nucleoid-associated protein YejK [Aliidiomarina iranensis]|uniref:Nucleoid-associated protein YejK n=1 Tax=Aliidiomarina iranensis TaxID=1434071 RepID=A0A432W0A4_9GAMM|nr:nucleoid-associated protein YejK [Aliidiomarina iranensis]RUO22454.1 nucleoid-associated protein YejK [Aliidiomarina iranensis]
MTLSVSASIVHQVYQDPAGDFGLRFSPAALNSEAEVATLLDEMNEVYNAKPSKGYASFIGADDPLYADARDSGEVVPEPEFPKLLADWLSQDTDFVNFSQQVARLLQQELSRYSFAESGFLLLADYQEASERFLLVSFLPVREGVMVQPDLSVNKSAQLDVTKVQLAARINLTEFQAKADDFYYVSFIKGKTGRKTAEFFLDFLGCVERVNSKSSTKQLVDTVQAFVKEAEITEEDANNIRKSVFEYCGEQWQRGEQVQMRDLDERLQEQGATSLQAFSESKGKEIPESFPADRSSLRQLVKFQGQGGGLSMAFDQSMLGQRVVYDVDTDTLTLKGTPPNLRDQLRRYYGMND